MKKIALIYAYIVCLAAIVSTFVAAGYLVMNIFDFASPNSASWSFYYEGIGGQDFETFHLGHVEAAKRKGTEPMKEPELRRLFESKSNEQFESMRFEAKRSIVAYGLLFFGAILLFVTHFTWAKRMVKADAT